MSVIRLNKQLYEKVKNNAKESNKTITELSNEIVEFYFYHKENELDHKLEKYIHDKLEKMDKHLSSIMIKNAKDTCAVFMGVRDIFRFVCEKEIESNEIMEEFERLGQVYFNSRWKKGK